MKKAINTDNILVNIAILSMRYGVSDRELCLSMRFCDETYRRRRKNPQSFTLGEIELVAKKLHTTPDKLLGDPKKIFD